MRKQLLDVPNVHAHAQAAARRNGTADWVQEVEQLAEVQTTPEVVGLGEILRGEVELTTRTHNGSPAVIRVPHTILAVLVTVALAMIGAGYWLVSSITAIQKDLTTIQQTQTQMRDEYQSDFKVMRAYATAESNRVNFFVGLMTREQQERANEYDRTHPPPTLPDKKSYERDN